jgi:hypothetical protein
VSGCTCVSVSQHGSKVGGCEDPGKGAQVTQLFYRVLMCRLSTGRWLQETVKDDGVSDDAENSTLAYHSPLSFMPPRNVTDRGTDPRNVSGRGTDQSPIHNPSTNPRLRPRRATATPPGPPPMLAPLAHRMLMGGYAGREPEWGQGLSWAHGLSPPVAASSPEMLAAAGSKAYVDACFAMAMRPDMKILSKIVAHGQDLPAPSPPQVIVKATPENTWSANGREGGRALEPRPDGPRCAGVEELSRDAGPDLMRRNPDILRTNSVDRLLALPPSVFGKKTGMCLVCTVLGLFGTVLGLFCAVLGLFCTVLGLRLWQEDGYVSRLYCTRSPWYCTRSLLYCTRSLLYCIRSPSLARRQVGSTWLCICEYACSASASAARLSIENTF